MVEAVSFVHGRKMTHLDIKDENMIVSPDFHVKLLDFDRARPAKGLVDCPTGTPRYQAPEVVSGEP